MKKVVKSLEEWEKELTPEQFESCRMKGTERAFTGKYYQTKDDGVYRCVCCENKLFRSDDKYDSGSGWPSFKDMIEEGTVYTKRDTTLGMARDEILCSSCDSHLGHVFDDGPSPSGKRFCVNSVALKLVEK